MIPYEADTTATTQMPSHYMVATSYGTVYVEVPTQQITLSNSSTDSTTAGPSFNFNPRYVQRTYIETPQYDAPEPEPAVYPLRVYPLKLCPCRTTPLSEPMAECYWQRGPPYIFDNAK